MSFIEGIGDQAVASFVAVSTMLCGAIAGKKVSKSFNFKQENTAKAVGALASGLVLLSQLDSSEAHRKIKLSLLVCSALAGGIAGAKDLVSEIPLHGPALTIGIGVGFIGFSAVNPLFGYFLSGLSGYAVATYD